MSRGFYALLILIMLRAASLTAQTVSYYESSGRYLAKKLPMGSSEIIYSSRGTTELFVRQPTERQKFFYAPNGSYLGREWQYGNDLYQISRPNGTVLGTARATGNSIYYYKSSGELIGYEKRMGSAAYFYDRTGRLVQRASISATPQPSPRTVTKQLQPAPTPLFTWYIVAEEAAQRKR
ncbi:MAG: hypothetical protein N2Z21_09930 [Candidatus Sumerlaeaceae bacterium]|nr:hypothetical protein [Candidatus Sumerlaeaceae bacterium]